MSDRPSPLDEPWVPPPPDSPNGLLGAGPPASSPSSLSLLGYGDPVMSLLGNVFSGGRVGADQVAAFGGGGSQLSPVQHRSAADALMAAGATLANAGGARLGPQPTWAQALTGAMAAGSSAAEEGQTRQMLLDQSQQVLAQSARDSEVRRQLMQKQIEQADLAARVIKAGATGALGGGGPAGVSPALQGDGAAQPAGDYPGSGVRTALADRESRGAGYSAANSAGFLGKFQLGAGLATDAKMYSPATGEDLKANNWAGRFNIPGHPEVQTRDDFLRSPAAQEQAYRLAMSHNDQQLAQLGVYDRAAARGNKIGGVPVTREGLLAGAWLGGVDGVRDWVDTDGRVNHADSNRTRVGDYVRLGATAAPAAPAGGTQIAAAAPATATDAPTPMLPPDQQVAAPATGAGGGLPPTPVPPGATRPAGAFANVSPQQWAALALVPFGKQGEALAKMLDQPGGTTTTIEDPNTHVHWLWRTDRQGNPVARIGLAPTDPKHVNVLSPDGQQLEIHTVLPGGAVGPLVGYAPHEVQITEIVQDGHAVRGAYVPGKGFVPIGQAPRDTQHVNVVSADGKSVEIRPVLQGGALGEPVGMAPHPAQHVNVLSADGQELEIHSVLPGGGIDPKVEGHAPHTAQMTEFLQDGRNVRGVYVPGKGFQVVGDAPLPPELATKPEGRIRSNIAEQAGIAGATKDEENARKAQADLYAGRDRAAQTRTQLDMLDALQDPQGKFNTGAITPQLATAGAFAASLGVPLGSIAPGLSPDAAVNAQVFQKITNGLALSHIGPGGLPANTFSEADRNFVSAMGPQLTNAPAANRLITGYMRATNARQLEQADRWDAWRQDPAHQAVPGGPDSAASWRQFQTEWSRYANSNPVVQPLKGGDFAARRAEIEALPPGRLWYYIDNKRVLQGGLSQGSLAPAPPPGG